VIASLGYDGGVERRELTGQVLDGRYRVLGPVGQGAMGSVYRGEHLKLGRLVAIKVMNEQVPSDDASRRRFDREAMAMAKLEHPHCASVLDVGMHDGQPFVVMDFVSGETLKSVVDQGPLPIPRAVEITRQILSGLAHAHEHGVIHRDIKPANIVLSQKAGLGDQLKILDFGLAKLNQETSNLTSGVIVGTPSYMAPEQIRGLLIDARVDLYACGVLLFELLTGTKPYRSANNEPLEVCMMHLHTPVPRLADVRPGHDFGALEAVVARALAKERDARFASASEFASALLAAVGRSGYATPPAGIETLPAPRVSGVAQTVPIATAELAEVRGDTPTLATPGPQAPVQLPPSSDTPPPSATVQLPPSPPVSAPPPARASAPVLARPSSEPSVVAVTASSPSRRGLVLGGGGMLVAGIAVAIVLASRGGSKAEQGVPAAAGSSGETPAGTAPPPSEPPASPASPEPPGSGDAVADLLARAGKLGRESAIELLTKARKTYPEDARLPYHAGLLYMDKMWWDEGLKQFRAAIQLDDAYRSDPDLIKAVLRGYNTTKSVDWPLASFLRKDLGAPAKPYLEEVAAGHPNPIIRKRAARELRNFR